MVVVSVEYRYLDVIWLDNFIMNYILLWTVSKVSKDKTPQWRLCIASFIGAVYVVLLIISTNNILDFPITKMILSVCMVLIGYRYTSWPRLFRLIGLFYGITFAFGGAAFGVYFFTKDILTIKKGVFYLKNFPAKIILTSSVAVAILIRLLWPKIRKRWLTSNLIYSINIRYGETDFIIKGLLDTGNSLYDPVTQSPVIIVEYSKIQKALPTGIRDIFMQSREHDLDYVAKVISGAQFNPDFRLIPYYAVGKPGGFLIGLRPNRVLISLGGDWHMGGDIIVALYAGGLSRDGEYHALIHPEMVCTDKQ